MDGLCEKCNSLFADELDAETGGRANDGEDDDERIGENSVVSSRPVGLNRSYYGNTWTPKEFFVLPVLTALSRIAEYEGRPLGEVVANAQVVKWWVGVLVRGHLVSEDLDVTDRVERWWDTTQNAKADMVKLGLVSVPRPTYWGGVRRTEELVRRFDMNRLAIEQIVEIGRRLLIVRR